MKHTQEELELKFKAIGKLSEDEKKKITCALIGHSKIVESCFGYITCARCDSQLGDTLGGIYDTSSNVIVDHECEACKQNWIKLSWEDKFLVEYDMDTPEKKRKL